MNIVVKDPAFVALEAQIERIWDIATTLGLKPFPTHFEVVPASIMYEFGSYGLPGRFSHWTHGRAYHQMKTMYDYGLSTIYELVINTNPCYAFLMDANTPLENKLVVAHVLAHSDFFAHNVNFAHTNRQMAESASIHAERIKRYEYDHGSKEVELFLDSVLSLEDHIDFSLLEDHTEPTEPDWKKKKPTTKYDDLLNLGEPKEEEPKKPRFKKIPPEPTRDLLGFLITYARELEDWQRDVISIVREERLYFTPQIRTKILNEGWATYWHCRILRELDLPSDEYTEFAALNANVASPSKRSLNPYYVGMKMLEAVQERWEHPTKEDVERLGLPGGQGIQKLFEVRELESDASFVRNYLTRKMVEDLDLYIYGPDSEGNLVVTEKDWEKIRDKIVTDHTHYGVPHIRVLDGDYQHGGELYLKHDYDGQELDELFTRKTLNYLYDIWGKVVHIETIKDGASFTYKCDGRDLKTSHG